MSPEEAREWLMRELKACPGGVLASEFRRVMRASGAKGWQNVGAILAAMPEDVPIWEQKDEEGDTWIKLLRPGEVQVKRRPAPMKQQKKYVVVTTIDPPAQTKIDADVHRDLKVHLARVGGSMQSFVSQAVRDKLEQEGA